MIRPLDYCTKQEHFDQSIDTINQRIDELEKLKIQYQKKSASFEKIDTLIKDSVLDNKLNNSKILVIDNYDSFTYNLVHLLQELNYDTR